MEQITSRLKKWGNSFAIVVPKQIVQKRKLTEGSEVSVILEPKGTVTVGELMAWAERHPVKIKKGRNDMLRILDRELWGMK
jgi:antitoxin component of MazEF toxin-antitoxin module